MDERLALAAVVALSLALFMLAVRLGPEAPPAVDRGPILCDSLQPEDC